MVNGIYTIDAHCHIYPEKIASRAVAGTDNFYGENSVGTGTVSDLLERGISAGVDHFIVQSVATTPHQVASINNFIAAEVSKNPQKLTGLGTLHPESEDIKGDVEHILELGLKGVKHTGDNRYDYSNPNRLLPVLDIYKNLTVIGAHLGGWSIWNEACEAYKEYPNFFVDCSSSFNYLDKADAKRIIRAYGADKVLFGTDYPMWSPSAELEYFLSLGLDESEIMCILNINAKRIFDLE